MNKEIIEYLKDIAKEDLSGTWDLMYTNGVHDGKIALARELLEMTGVECE